MEKRPKKRGANEPAFDVRSALYRMCGQDLTVIEGIDTNTSLVILSEIGCDMSKWPMVKGLSRKARELGFELVPMASKAAATT